MDSCCFIELALHGTGKHDAQRDNDVWFLKQLLTAAIDGEVDVFTSTLSIAECSHARGDVSDDIKVLFKRFLTSGLYVLLIQDSVIVAEKARNLRWVHGLSFSGADSIHIASALELQCEEFLTWDNKPHAHKAELNDLALSVLFPHDTHCLPDSYRQSQLQIAAPPPVEAAPVAADPSKAKPKEVITEGQPQAISTPTAGGGTDAPPSPTLGSAVAEPEQSALEGVKQKLGQQASPPSPIIMPSAESKAPASEKPAGAESGS